MQTSQEIDMIDRRILAALQADARLSSAQLGEQLALSQSPTWRRLKRLEDEGYISGYHAVLDRQKMACRCWPWCMWAWTAMTATPPSALRRPSP